LNRLVIVEDCQKARGAPDFHGPTLIPSSDQCNRTMAKKIRLWW
jgi:hypothetical protein